MAQYRRQTNIKTDCSGCRVDLVVHREAGTVSAGSQIAHLSGDDDMLTWDCPICGHADSLDLNYDPALGW